MFIRIVARNFSLHKTALYDNHIKLNGRMVPYAGYLMPVQFEQPTVLESAEHLRKKAGIFDVSHMLQMSIKGKRAKDFLETLSPVDITRLNDNNGQLSMYLTPNGGILDDIIVNKINQEEFYVVSNAGCRDKVLGNIQKHISSFDQVETEIINKSLIAVQGPLAEKVVLKGLGAKDGEQLTSLKFMESFTSDSLFNITMKSKSIHEGVRITRCGYTGEDGFEISIPNDYAPEIYDQIMRDETIVPCGLAARDILRMEAGLCLYGNDIDETVNILEAGLLWTLSKDRRCSTPKFIGHESTMKAIAEKKVNHRRRKAFVWKKGPPGKKDSVIFDAAGVKVGSITSSCYSPNIKMNIAMGYLDVPGESVNELFVEVRSKLHKINLTKMPFLPTNYKK